MGTQLFYFMWIPLEPLPPKYSVVVALSMQFCSCCRDRSGCCGQRIRLAVPSPQAVFRLPGRDSDADAQAGHSALDHFQHDYR